MPYKSKINLYNIDLPKNTTNVATNHKHFGKIKFGLLSVLALTTMLSIGQSLVAFDTKTSFADRQIQSSLSSTAVSSKSQK